MKLNQIFSKPVDRVIEGVIKADDESALKIELEEYVLTNEISKRLEDFLDAYNTRRAANGAWISGFFGSGKSHLLKILALLLENREIEGIPTSEYFLPKCADNAILRGSLLKALNTPSKSILFNIDQKADLIAKAQTDAILSVFVKVFDEMCGYYGKQGYIAQFERDLDNRGLYGPFKDAYRLVAGKNWERGREEVLLEGENIQSAYTKITASSPETASGIMDKYRADYKVSIEDFAVQVNEYIQKFGKDFRLNFFVDEVGQFIANNVRLMTNLQTIAESLETKCGGRAWIVVTAQEDMDKIIGEMNTQQGNDFTKIQARFAVRLKLTSQNVAEVIQKRLLLKNAQGETLLEDVYRQQHSNFGTLFDFLDGSISYRKYRDTQHFINSYPFVPYQFDLFQAAIQNLSLHNAFEGRHSSVGERSMLAVFQQVAILIANHEVGQLATFDLMFEGIRTVLKAQIQQAILTAENNLESEFAIRILKALFLIKYVKGFKATIHNLSILMYDRFDQDLGHQQKRVEEALNLLEQQTYIQRNGELYEYLTNEEKDVEEEIKNLDIDSTEVSSELGKLIFDNILRDRKIHYDDTDQDFPFTRKLDNQLMGRESELTIHVVSPFYEHFENEEILKMHSMGRDELLVILPADNRLIQDLWMYKRTEKYIRQSMTTTQQDSIQRILMDKGFQNQERYKLLEQKLRTLLGGAKLFISGRKIENGSNDPSSKIIKGFYELIRVTYPNLKMLRGIKYKDSDIEANLRLDAGTLFGQEGLPLNEAEQEILASVQANARNGVRTTLKSLIEKFERKPYGWSLAAIQCNTARLVAHSKIEARSDGNILEDADLARALRNTQKLANVILDPMVEFSTTEIRALKTFFEDFFDKPPQASEARELGKEFAQALELRLADLKNLFSSQALYPFLAELSEPINRLKEISGKSYQYYLTDLLKKNEDLSTLKNDVIAPILSFWNGAQKGLYDEVRQFYQTHRENFDNLDGDEAEQLANLLADTQVYQNKRMQQARNLMTTLKEKIDTKLKEQKSKAIAALRTRQDRLVATQEFASLTSEQQGSIQNAFESATTLIGQQTLIAKVRDYQRKFEEEVYPGLLARLSDDKTALPTSNEPGTTSGVSEAKIAYISKNSLNVEFDKAWLADDQDVEKYLSALRSALLQEIKNGKRIQI